MDCFPNHFKLNQLKTFQSKKCLVLRRSETDEEIFTYEDVIKEAELLSTTFNKLEISKNARICVRLDHSPEICAVILSILDRDCSFCPVQVDCTEDQLLEAMKAYKSCYVISVLPLSETTNVILHERITLFGQAVNVYKLGNGSSSAFVQIANHCYSIRTSGSTGEPKVVHVLWSCIEPNIVELSKVFQISFDDVILMASPPTFDPFIVEMFLAIYNGASLLITAKSIRWQPERFIKVLFPPHSFGVSLIQMTPSVFRIFGTDFIRDHILNENSCLKHLVLGGEPFPTRAEIRQWMPKTEEDQRHCQLFNIYGITELSCWSTIEKISDLDSEATIGTPIDDSTLLEVRDEDNKAISNGIGELFVGSSKRICLIGDESLEAYERRVPVFRSTGDLVCVKNGKISYRERKNDVVKRYGHRVSLRKIEEMLSDSDCLENVSCVFSEKDNLLLVYVIARNDTNGAILRNKMMKTLQNHERPDDIIFVDSFPLSSHGKVSKVKLLQAYKERRHERVFDIFKKSLEHLTGEISFVEDTNTGPEAAKRRRGILDSTFVSLGGRSIQSLQIASKIEEASGTAQSHILEMLLSDTSTVADIFKEIDKIQIKTGRHESQIQADSSTKIQLLWKFDTGKCVDATPTVIRLQDKRTVISVGSHSHLLANLEAHTGHTISILRLPDRIESQVAHAVGTSAWVGCYDGVLYEFNVITGEILWKFNTLGMIKSRPLILDNFLLVGNYSPNDNLFCFDISSYFLVWSLRVGSKSIFSPVVQLNKDLVIVCGLDGTCACIQHLSGVIEWEVKLQNPVFSRPVVLDGSAVLVAEVSGIVHCFDFRGNELWSFKGSGSIFSSFEILSISKRIHILFGCHDDHLYCLRQGNASFSLLWKINLSSPIFSTPKVVNTNVNNEPIVVVCTTKGVLSLIGVSQGTILESIRVGGEVFSNICINDNQCMIGCRDNHVYCFNIDQQMEKS